VFKILFKQQSNQSKSLTDSFGKVKEEAFYFNLIDRYFKGSKHSKATFQRLDDAICADLDFEELFMFLDRTRSKVGQQYLYNRLRNIPKASMGEKEALQISRFQDDEKYRLSIEKILLKLKNGDAYYLNTLFQDTLIKPPKWMPRVKLLSLTPIVSFIGAFFNPIFIFISLGLFIVNMAIHYWNKRNVYPYISSLPQLLNLLETAKALNKKAPDEQNISNTLKQFDQIKKRISFFKIEARLDGDMSSIFWGFLELIKMMLVLEPIMLFNILKGLENKRAALATVFEYVGEQDFLLSIASLRQGLPYWCQYDYNANPSVLKLEQLYHPLLVDFVANSLSLTGKSLLLTGSNMSGKTTFIRTVGVSTLCGQVLNTCFAKHMSLPRSKIFSTIRVNDDIMQNKSYFLEEVTRIKTLIEASEKDDPCLFLLDEILKGTNTMERIAAGEAVLSHLSKNNNLVLVATHDLELATSLHSTFELYHFAEEIIEQKIVFDYKIKEGTLQKTNAIEILKLKNYPESITNNAQEAVKRMSTKTTP